MSILTESTLGSWNDFDVSILLIGSKEIMWTTSFEVFTNNLQLYIIDQYSLRNFLNIVSNKNIVEFNLIIVKAHRSSIAEENFSFIKISELPYHLKVDIMA